MEELAVKVVTGAYLSQCGRYRYHLWRIWDECLPTMVWVMHNPSTADATTDDPTIRRCMRFAKREGFGGISVRNVFALRATDPRELLVAKDPYGCNDDYLLSCRHVSIMTKLMVAWGNRLPGKRLRSFYQNASVILSCQAPHCLGTTKSGEPRHPLFVKHDAKICPWMIA